MPSSISSSGIEIINGHQYLVTRVDGVATNLSACDSAPIPTPTAAIVKARLLIGALVNGSATPQQRDMALAAVLALQMGLVDVTSSS